MEAIKTMNELVSIRKGKSNQVSLAELQNILDARAQVADDRSVVSTRKARVEEAKRVFEIDPEATLNQIMLRAQTLSDAFDKSIDLEAVPLSQKQINRLSDEFFELEALQAQVAALETRYRALVFAHLDETAPKVPGRPAAQVPGKVGAKGPGDHYIFERRGGNREDPDLDVVGLKDELPAEVVSQIYVTVHHEAVEAHDEQIFDAGRFGELVNEGVIDLDVVAKYLTAGKWRTPSFNKTLVSG
jgi:hypothetical protein